LPSYFAPHPARIHGIRKIKMRFINHVWTRPTPGQAIKPNPIAKKYPNESDALENIDSVIKDPDLQACKTEVMGK
jgi:hypothetical protein